MKIDEKTTIANVTKQAYPFGFVSNIPSETSKKGLTLATVHFISKKRQEPKWLLEWRIKAFARWQTMTEPTWGNVEYSPINYQNIHYYSAPKKQTELNSIDELDPEIRDTFDKLGIPLEEQKRLSNVAVDAVIDSVSVATTLKKTLAKHGIIFCSLSEAVRQYPELIKKHLGSVVPLGDNYFATLNAAVFSDGSFVYIPKNVRCPVELSTYFRMNAPRSGQFERTLIIAEENSYVSYLEGCTAPRREENQLHAAVVEIVAERNAEVRYATIQNWFPGDEQGGGVYNFVTKRGLAQGDNSKISWTQVETGAAITWKYPSVILKGDNSSGEFYSVAVTNGRQQADTGTKMIHLGRNTKSTVIAKSIAAGHSKNSYRGLIKMTRSAKNGKNYSECDSLLIGNKCSANTFPTLETMNNTASSEHEATTTKIKEEQLFYLNQRGLRTEDAIGLIVNGYCRKVMEKLPMEFAVEAKKLLSLVLKDSVG